MICIIGPIILSQKQIIDKEKNEEFHFFILLFFQKLDLTSTSFFWQAKKYIILKLFFTGKFDKISTVMYLLMGWQVMFFIKPLINVLTNFSLNLLIAGGVFYTVGAILYSIKNP